MAEGSADSFSAALNMHVPPHGGIFQWIPRLILRTVAPDRSEDEQINCLKEALPKPFANIMMLDIKQAAQENSLWLERQ